jgi:hypothetical protein
VRRRKLASPPGGKPIISRGNRDAKGPRRRGCVEQRFANIWMRELAEWVIIGKKMSLG